MGRFFVTSALYMTIPFKKRTILTKYRLCLKPYYKKINKTPGVTPWGFSWLEESVM